ncbi:MAG: hypothetical protein U0R52_02660 [Solirubrobacterales bacterium]
MAARRPTTQTIGVAILLLIAALTLASCGSSSEEVTGLAEGEPVTLGKLQYNVVFSRYLNPQDIEDRDYLVGQPPPPKDTNYLGVWMQVINKDKESPQELPPSLTVTDTQGEKFTSIPSESIFALNLGDSIDKEDQAPALDSAPQSGPVQASVVLFLIPDDSAEDRPLQLVIPGEGGPATVDLDI